MKTFAQLYSETVEEQRPICKTFPSGAKYWFLNTKLHRIDGPAIQFPNGEVEWYLYGREYTEKEFNIAIKNFKPEDRQKALDALDV